MANHVARIGRVKLLTGLLKPLTELRGNLRTRVSERRVGPSLHSIDGVEPGLTVAGEIDRHLINGSRSFRRAGLGRVRSGGRAVVGIIGTGGEEGHRGDRSNGDKTFGCETKTGHESS